MIALTVKEVAAAIGGRLDGADPDTVIGGVVVDSRRASNRALFVALPGEQTDGHRFVDAALAAGAAAAVVREDAPAAGALIRVADTTSVLADLAREVRDRLRCRVIAVTGSSGKTTTKDMIAAACSSLRVVATEASFNAEIGVPLTIMAADEQTDVLVVEVGSRGIGHIAALMPLVRPHVSVVTNVGPAHLGMFGSLENTARAKGELVEALDADGVAVLNAGDAAVRAMAGRTQARPLLYGRSAECDVRASDVTLDPDARATFTVHHDGEQVHVTLQVPGDHMVDNALAAVAAARAAGAGLADAAVGVEQARVSAWRMEVHDAGGLRVLNDAYNANPDSMLAALKTLVSMGGDRPTWAVLGHMAELGERATEEHDRIGRMAVRLGIKRLLVVGREAKAILEAARLEGLFDPEESFFAADPAEAIDILRARVERDAVVLVKASRAAGLEVVAGALLEGAA